MPCERHSKDCASCPTCRTSEAKDALRWRGLLKWADWEEYDDHPSRAIRAAERRASELVDIIAFLPYSRKERDAAGDELAALMEKFDVKQTVLAPGDDAAGNA